MKAGISDWIAFEKSGKISDYLAYKGLAADISQKGEVENAENNIGRGDKGTNSR